MEVVYALVILEVDALVAVVPVIFESGVSFVLVLVVVVSVVLETIVVLLVVLELEAALFY